VIFGPGSALAAIWASRFALLNGLATTIETSAAAIVIGLLVGGLAALGGVFASPTVQLPVRVYVYLLRGVPLLVTILFTYFGAGAFWPSLPAAAAATMAMGLFAGAQMAEIFRGAILAIPSVQFDAAKAIGLAFGDRIRSVVAPLALRRAIPSLTNIAIEVVKASTLVSALGTPDLFLAGQQVAARTLLIPETYATLWAVYLCLCLLISLAGRWLESRFEYIAY
jgi:polar amino acid transport system permease protein